MESNFNNRDFEQFVKQSTDQYRMFPSEKVWKGVHTALHGRRRWYYGLALTLLLLTGGAVTWIMVTPGYRADNLQPVAESKIASTNTVSEVTQPDILNPRVAKTQLKKNQLPFAVNNQISGDEPAIEEFAASIPIQLKESLANSVAAEKPSIQVNTPVLLSNKIISGKKIPERLPEPVAEQKEIHSIIHAAEAAPIAGSTLVGLDVEETQKAVLKETYPYTIESVVNSYRPDRKKWSFQVYFTPTISYRKLSENKEFLEAFSNSGNISANTSGYTYMPDIDNAVIHKPDMGLNLGVTAGYSINEKLKLTGGLQFNVSRYDIKAYNYQQEEATIALNTGLIWNSEKVTTSYRNYAGYDQNWLRNLYFSVSLPIGADLVLIGNQTKPYLGIAATFQPMFILDNNAYLISADYKNYATMPSLINQWNFGTSFETYAGYSTGRINWKIGPQVRYQLGSSFMKKYPVKEHIFDFGMKVGVMLNK